MAELPCPWLPWSTPNGEGEIRYVNPDARAVDGEVWLARGGWRWMAAVTPYVRSTCEELGVQMDGVPKVPGEVMISGVHPADSDVDARAACEDWIVGEVAGG